MRSETIASIRMLASADPEATPEIVDAIIEACKPQKQVRRDLIDGQTARAIIGGARPISKVTLSKWVKKGKVRPVRVSPRIYKYDRHEIELLAYGQPT
jgi:hypothetical protein